MVDLEHYNNVQKERTNYYYSQNEMIAIAAGKSIVVVVIDSANLTHTFPLVATFRQHLLIQFLSLATI